MKLSTPLFNAVLEQVKVSGPDADCFCDSESGPFDMYGNEVYNTFLRTSVTYMKHEPMAAFHTMIYIGFVSGLQYAKVSREVQELNKMTGGGL